MLETERFFFLFFLPEARMAPGSRLDENTLQRTLGLCDSNRKSPRKKRTLLKDASWEGRQGSAGGEGQEAQSGKMKETWKWLLFQEMALISSLDSTELGRWPLAALGLLCCHCWAVTEMLSCLWKTRTKYCSMEAAAGRPLGSPPTRWCAHEYGRLPPLSQERRCGPR